MKFLAWAWLAVILLPSPLPAAGPALAEINLRLKVNIVEAACNIAPVTPNINLGVWGTRSFHRAGDMSAPKEINIVLFGCSNTEGVSVSFDGKPQGTTTYLALNGDSTAKNIAIQLQESDQTPLPVNQPARKTVPDKDGNLTLKYYARYVALADNVSGGTANADAMVRVYYY